jgi:hypothetical protein
MFVPICMPQEEKTHPPTHDPLAHFITNPVQPSKMFLPTLSQRKKSTIDSLISSSSCS